MSQYANVEALKQKIDELKPKASGKPTPARGMAMLRRGRAKSDLAKAKQSVGITRVEGQFRVQLLLSRQLRLLVPGLTEQSLRNAEMGPSQMGIPFQGFPIFLNGALIVLLRQHGIAQHLMNTGRFGSASG